MRRMDQGRISGPGRVRPTTGFGRSVEQRDQQHAGNAAPFCLAVHIDGKLPDA